MCIVLRQLARTRNVPATEVVTMFSRILSSTNHHRCATRIKDWINIFFIDL